MKLIALMPLFTGTVLNLMVVFAGAALLAARLSRPDLFFSTTVDPSLRGSADGRKILRQFSGSVILATILGLALVLAAVFSKHSAVLSSLLLVAALLVEVTGIIKSYTTARRSVTPYRVAPSTEREAAIGPRPIFTIWMSLGQAGPFVILGIVSLWLWLHWSDIPAHYPIHWGMDGRPNGWGTRSVGDVFLLPLIGVIVCAFLAILLNGMARGVRRIHSSGPEAEKESRNLRNMLWLILGVEYWLAVVLGLSGLLPLILKPGEPHIPVTMITAISVGMGIFFTLVVILLAVRSGQGGWRLSGANNREPVMHTRAPVGDRTPDACWKGGIIYYNPNDPALWVEKRFGIGWTLNMASPRAWFVLGLILFFSLGMLVFGIISARK